MKKLTMLFLAFAILGLSLAGCSGDDDDSTAGDTTATPAA